MAARIGVPDVAPVLPDVGHRQHAGMSGKGVLVERVDLDRAEPLAERELPPGGEALPPEDEHPVVGEGAVGAGAAPAT